MKINVKKYLDFGSITRPFSRRFIFIILGLVIGISSLVFTGNMARTLRNKERNEVTLWGLAMNRSGAFDSTDPLVEHIVSSNNNIPFIITDKNLHVEGAHLIPDNVLVNPDLLRRKLEQFSSIHQPLEVRTWNQSTLYIFYGESRLLKMLVYYPIIQILIIAIFIAFGFLTFLSTKHDEQNNVWIGLAKETAHQLGTPTSSLLGWVDYLRTQPIDQHTVDEMGKDISRLLTIVDRFSKIGSETSLAVANVNEVVGSSVQYYKSRTPRNIAINYNGLAIAPIKAMLNIALFEWVIENLLKNAIDAMQGKGSINVNIGTKENNIFIDVSDEGKGIPKANFSRIFEPGYTTKTRGWGLGLSLSKRIVEEYHKGRIFVVDSEINKGTTFRIMLKKAH